MKNTRVVLLLVTFVGATVLCMVTIAVEREAISDRIQDIQKRLAAGEVFSAYVEARRVAVALAGDIARDRYEQLIEKYALEGKDYDASQEYKELVAVASDAWPVLRGEWKRLKEQPQSNQRASREGLLANCWVSIGEERALGLLMERVLKEEGKALVYRNLANAGAVERISGVEHGRVAKLTPEGNQAYYERIAQWWRAYEPNWKAKMAAAEARAAATAETNTK